jgi:hypothetical protein
MAGRSPATAVLRVPHPLLLRLCSLPMAPFLAPRHPDDGPDNALTSAPGRIRTRDPLLRRYRWSVARRRSTGRCSPAASIPALCSSSGNGQASGGTRSWPTGNGPGGTSSCSRSSRWRSIESVSENYLPVVVGVAVVGDHVLRLLFSDGTAGMSTSRPNSGRASSRR